MHAKKESELIVAGEDRLQLPFFPARSSTNVTTLNFQKDIYGDGFNWKKRKSLSQINVDILRREAFAMESNMGYFPKFKCLEGIGSFPFHSESIRMDSCRKSSSRNARSFSKSSRSQQFIRRSSSPCISSKPFSSSEKICRAHSSVQLFHHKARIPGFLNLHADPEHQCQYAYCDELRNTIRVSNAVFTSMNNILGSVWPRNGSTITDLAGNLRPFCQPCSSSAANVELQRVGTHSFLVTNKKRKISKGIARSASRDFQEVEDNVEVPAQALMEALLFSFGVGVGVLHLLCANNGNHGNLVPQQISLIQTGNGFLPEKSHHLEGAEENQCLDLREKQDLEAGHRHEFLRSTDSFACPTEVFSQQGDGGKSVSCEFELEAQTQGCMNELEAEFQAELDMMKQSLIDISTCMQAGEFSDISKRELHCMGGARSAELSNGHIKVVNGETGTASSQVAQRYQAVSPRELDRRLRIVLQTRQEERISELEAEVTALKQELNAKEQEFQSYKDRVCQLTLLSTASNLSREPDSNEIIVCEKKTMDTQLNRPPFSNHFHGNMALGVLSDESQLVHLQQKSLSGQDSMEDKISKHMRIAFGKRGEELTQVLPGTFQGEDSRLRIHSGNPANDIRTVCHSRLQESVVVNMKANSEEATSSTYCVLDNSSNYSSKCGYSTVISDSICGDSLRDTAIFRVSEQTEVDKCERQETYIQMMGVKDNSTEWRYLETSKKKMVSETDKLCVPISDIYDRNDRFTIVRKGSKALIHPENSQVYTDHSENERATCVPAVCVEEEFYQTRRKNGKADAPASTPVGSSHRSKQVMFEVCKELGKEDLPLYSLEGETESFPVIREFGNFLEPLSQSICHSKSHAFGEDNSASDSEESLGEELIKQIVQKTRSGSSLLKDAQMILNMLENDDRCQYY
ncbi:hypothetical protein O6H91_06G000300 [Diphasiastrum complanatum]|uniref:Uncharacterized protein n=1 Tax=Diphasiastrum complanatum TaxID=34168 RepID=A0ACC2DAD5_DIPCM|nr:hypothetical protein O6H91_06G000300 [Diphasiastrum complanatum]